MEKAHFGVHFIRFSKTISIKLMEKVRLDYCTFLYDKKVWFKLKKWIIIILYCWLKLLILIEMKYILFIYLNWFENYIYVLLILYINFADIFVNNSTCIVRCTTTN